MGHNHNYLTILLGIRPFRFDTVLALNINVKSAYFVAGEMSLFTVCAE